jgi:hypothetical protein
MKNARPQTIARFALKTAKPSTLGTDIVSEWDNFMKIASLWPILKRPKVATGMLINDLQ